MMNPIDDVEGYLGELDKEEAQEKSVEAHQGSYFNEAPSSDVLRRRAREYDDLPKHVVRRRHWLKVVNGLFKSKGKGLRILTLPGRYALEIVLYQKLGLLEEVFRASDAKNVLYAVGFETSPDVYGLLQSSDVQFLRLFDGSLIETLTDYKSTKYKELCALFPFDVINLDLTVNLVAPDEGPYGPIPAAITECFKMQGAQPHNWALMLTFRSGLPQTDKKAIEVWKNQYQDNLEKHPQLKDVCFLKHSSSTADELLARDGEEALGQFAAKWIADHAHTHNWKIKIARHLSYTREYEGGNYQIRKLIFEFERNKLPQYAMPGKSTPVVAWHLEDLVKVIGMKSFDVSALLEKARGSLEITEIETEIEELKAKVDGGVSEKG